MESVVPSAQKKSYLVRGPLELCDWERVLSRRKDTQPLISPRRGSGGETNDLELVRKGVLEG